MGKFKSSLTAMAVVVALGACSEQKAPEPTSQCACTLIYYMYRPIFRANLVR